MDRLESFGHLRDIDTERQRVTQVISTGDVARDGAIINPKGWDFSNYDRNPVVLWSHDDGAMPFARMVDHQVTAKELIATAEFDADDEMGQQVFRKITNGFINTTSVRWLPKRIERKPPPNGVDIPDRYKDADGNILWFMEQELLEFSYVSVPADPGALIVRADGSPFSVADYYAPAIYQPDLAWLRGLGLKQRSDEPPTGASVIFPSITEGLKNAAFLYLTGRQAEPAPTNSNGDLKRLEGLLLRYMERRGKQRDPEEMFVSALSRATGKSEERIRRHLAAEGGI